MIKTADGVKPWYREPWPWLLMAGPAAVIVAGFATLYLAVTTDDGLVVADYYKQGLAINVSLARDEKARALGLSATIELSPQRDRVQVRLAGLTGRPGRPRLRLVHPTRAGRDQSVLLVPSGTDTYISVLRPVEPGTWHVVLEDDTGGWRLSGTLSPAMNRVELSSRQAK